jgi:hypothetical protein
MQMATSKELRLENLRALVAEFKTADAVAQRAGTAPMYLSQILNGAKSSTGKARGVGDALARRLEEGCGKEVGWMDKPHHEELVDAPRSEEDALSHGETELLLVYRMAADPDKAFLLGVADAIRRRMIVEGTWKGPKIAARA